MKIKAISVSALILALAACQKGEQVAEVKPAIHEAHLINADILVVAPAPAPEGQMALYHKVGEDAIGAVTPMSGAEPFTALIGGGDHDVTPMQEGCKYTIEVEVRNAKEAAAAPTVIKLPAKQQNSVMLPGGELEERRVTAHMAADAHDNYSCNVMLRKKM